MPLGTITALYYNLLLIHSLLLLILCGLILTKNKFAKLTVHMDQIKILISFSL